MVSLDTQKTEGSKHSEGLSAELSAHNSCASISTVHTGPPATRSPSASKASSMEKADAPKSGASSAANASSAAQRASKLSSAELLLLLSPSIASSANLASAAGPYSCKICQAKFPSLHALGYHQAHHRRTSPHTTDPTSPAAGRGRKRSSTVSAADVAANEGMGDSHAKAADPIGLPTSPPGRSRKRHVAAAAAWRDKAKAQRKKARVSDHPTSSAELMKSSSRDHMDTTRVRGSADWQDPVVHDFAPLAESPSMAAPPAAVVSGTPVVRPTPSRASPPGSRQPSHLSGIQAHVLQRAKGHQQGLRLPAPLTVPSIVADMGPDSKASVVTQAHSELTADAGGDASNGLPLSPFSRYSGGVKSARQAEPGLAAPAVASGAAGVGPGAGACAAQQTQQSGLLAQLNALLMHQQQQQQMQTQLQPHQLQQQLHQQQQQAQRQVPYQRLPHGNSAPAAAQQQQQASFQSTPPALATQQQLLMSALKIQLQQQQQQPKAFASHPLSSGQAPPPPSPAHFPNPVPAPVTTPCCPLQCSAKGAACVSSPAALSAVLSLLTAVTQAAKGTSPPTPSATTPSGRSGVTTGFNAPAPELHHWQTVNLAPTAQDLDLELHL